MSAEALSSLSLVWTPHPFCCGRHYTMAQSSAPWPCTAFSVSFLLQLWKQMPGTWALVKLSCEPTCAVWCRCQKRQAGDCCQEVNAVFVENNFFLASGAHFTCPSSGWQGQRDLSDVPWQQELFQTSSFSHRGSIRGLEQTSSPSLHCHCCGTLTFSLLYCCVYQHLEQWALCAPWLPLREKASAFCILCLCWHVCKFCPSLRGVESKTGSLSLCRQQDSSCLWKKQCSDIFRAIIYHSLMLLVIPIFCY